MESAEKAKLKLRTAGFDPTDVTKEMSVRTTESRQSRLEAKRDFRWELLHDDYERYGYGAIDYDDVSLSDDDEYETWSVMPMIYFARQGDLPMCRYILCEGGSTTAGNKEGHWFPMYAAVLEGHLDVCKWLYEYSDDDDIRRTNAAGFSLLRVATSENSPPYGRTALVRWLVSKGALSHDDGTVDRTLMWRGLSPIKNRRYGLIDERRQLRR